MKLFILLLLFSTICINAMIKESSGCSRQLGTTLSQEYRNSFNGRVSRPCRPLQLHVTENNDQLISDDNDDEWKSISYRPDEDKPRISVVDVDPFSGSTTAASNNDKVQVGNDAVSKSKLSTTGSKPAEQSKKKSPFGSLSPDILRGYDTGKRFSNKPIPKEDLNGINPLIPLVFSVVPAGMCVLGWQLSAYLTETFAVQFIDESNPYPVQRAAIVARNLVVGLSALASGFTGVVAVGLFAMGCVVGVGVLKGELDPNKADEKKAG